MIKKNNKWHLHADIPEMNKLFFESQLYFGLSDILPLMGSVLMFLMSSVVATEVLSLWFGQVGDLAPWKSYFLNLWELTMKYVSVHRFVCLAGSTRTLLAHLLSKFPDLSEKYNFRYLLTVSIPISYRFLHILYKSGYLCVVVGQQSFIHWNHHLWLLDLVR